MKVKNMENNKFLDLSLVPKELKLILLIMNTENNENLRLNKNNLFTDIDWEYFLNLVIHHRVYPLIYTKLKTIQGKVIPPYVMNTLSYEYKSNTIKMLQFSGEMVQISELFIENKIRLLFLKGPVIAADIYGDISLRTSKDLDILIPSTDIQKAEEILCNLGYVREEEPDYNDWKWRNHHLTYNHPQKNTQIEIHWRLHPRPKKVPSFNKLWERKRESNLTRNPVYYLGKEDLFLYLIAHGSKHGWFRLRWLADIDLLVRKFISLEKSNLQIKKYQQQHLGGQAKLFVGQALILASQLFNTPINKEMQAYTEKKHSKRVAQMSIFYIKEMAQINIPISEEELAKNHKNYFLTIKSNLRKSFLITGYRFASKSNLEKLLFITRLFYPRTADKMALKLPRPLHFLYFPLRPFFWIWRKTRNI